MLSEVNQTKINISYEESKKKNQTHRSREQTGACQRQRVEGGEMGEGD
mgnify:CR=1 FL=1